MLTPRDLLLLEVRAETVDECFALLAAPNAVQPTDDAIGRVRAAAWDEALQTDNTGTLLRRVRDEGWEPSSLLDAVFKLPSWTNGRGWADDLNWLIDSLQDIGQESYDDTGLSDPFGHLLNPLCAAAWLRIGRTLAHSARVPLQRSILARLCSYAGPALYEEFVKFRESSAAARSPDSDCDSIYRAFIGSMRDGFFLPFLTRRPALARLMISLLTQWVEATDEFLDRLTADEQALTHLTGSHCSVRDLVTIRTNLSDPHNGGRSVFVLTFSSGARVVYKPRSLACDSIWNQLTTWLAAQGGPSIGSHPMTLDMGQYGWQAFCDHAPCSPESASGFYQRMGACLALFRVLGSSDMHHENLIANGDRPVFVDVETLVAPLPRVDFSVHPALLAVEQMLVRSVWRSGVLPDAMLLPTGDVMTYGALAQSPAVSGPVWGFININTDRMNFVLVERPRYQFSNLPKSDQEVFLPSAYVADIKAGYEKTMAVIRAHWAEMWDIGGPLAALPSAPIRAIFRPTAVYAALLNRLRDPRRLRGGISWSAQLELDQGTTRHLGVLADAHLLTAERHALMQVDIPYFETTVGQTTVWDSHVAISDAIEASQNARVRQSLIEVQDTHRDCQLIGWSLATSKVPPTVPWPRFDGDTIGEDHESLLVTEAERLFDVLRRRAVVADDGVAWWGRKSLLKAPSIGVLGAGFYDGLAGIAVFLAAMTRVCGNERAKDLTERTVATVRSTVHAHRPSHLRPRRTLGIAFGMGGVAYALTVVSKLLDQVQWLEVARDAAAWMTPEIIKNDRTFDMMDGSAGAIVALLRLYQATDEERWLASAILCGLHLLETHRGRHPWWTVPGRPIRTGMAHGLAGIGFALCRLSRISGRARFGELGMAALRLVDRSYDERCHDWSSEINEGSAETERSFWCRWCHGALGVGLAWHEQRRDAVSESDASRFVHRASQGALENPTRSADTLCCGNFGNVDYLLEIADGSEKLRSLARLRAVWLIGQSYRRGSYEFDGADDEANLGLFPGISGIGYVILRTLAPEGLPSLLTFS